MPRHHLKLVPPRKDKWGASRAQRAHRQLAWALYITEGFTANMAVAGKYELTSQERELLKAIQNSAASWCAAIRRRMK